ncbi:intersectin-2-like [Pollicipes pollicipes]|uniref:intersectin-2-like n=1 Tax=Pollicipes pollicipes TaxID=41117 RepID=UPI001885786B|nr:intersectin-2-like [Pollicipes pollicipes]
MGRSWWKFWQRKKPKKEQPNINIWSELDAAARDLQDRPAGDGPCPPEPEATQQMQLLLKEAVYGCRARAVRDHRDASDPQSLSFSRGDVITVLQQSRTGRWRGVILQSNYTSRTGSFPSSAVVLLERPEAVYGCRARAVRDHRDASDPQSLSFSRGDVITVLQQSRTGRWRGVILQSNYTSRTGSFPSSAVVLLERPGECELSGRVGTGGR